MNTFQNIQQEFKNDSTYWPIIITEIREGDLHKKINVRGDNEQYAAVALLHYNPHIKGRARRSSRFINSKFNSITYSN